MTTLGKEDNGGTASFEYGLNYWNYIPAILFLGVMVAFPLQRKDISSTHGLGKLLAKLNVDPFLVYQMAYWGCVALIGFGVVFLAINILSKPRFIKIQQDGIQCPSSLYSRKIYQIRRDDIVSVRQHDVFGQSSLTIEHRAGKLSIPSMAVKKGKISEIHTALEKWIRS